MINYQPYTCHVLGEYDRYVGDGKFQTPLKAFFFEARNCHIIKILQNPIRLHKMKISPVQFKKRTGHSAAVVLFLLQSYQEKPQMTPRYLILKSANMNLFHTQVSCRKLDHVEKSSVEMLT